MIVLETPHLLLRHLTLDDLAVVITLYSDPVVMASKETSLTKEAGECIFTLFSAFEFSCPVMTIR